MSAETTDEAALTKPAKPRAGRRKYPVSTVIACGWLAFIIIVTVLAPVLAPQGYNVQNIPAAYQGPSLAHILGTDSLGRDMLVRLLYGGVPALIGAAIAVVIAMVVGTAAGLAGGYLRGTLDRVLSVISDIFQSIPSLMILLVVFALFPGNVYLTMAVLGFFLSAPVYRIVRGTTLTISGELYVTAARAAGLSHVAIISRHLAPRIAPQLRVQASITAAVAIATEAGLGYSGLDVAPPAPSWGGIASDATHYLYNDPWMIIPPMFVICATTLACGVLGDAGQVGMRLTRSRRRRSRTAVVMVQSTSAPRSSSPAESFRAGSLPGRISPAGPAGALLSVRNLTVRTTSTVPITLVDDLSFDVRSGEVVGLVGESGAGKSVTVRALLKLDADASVTGTVTFDGEELTSADERQMRAIRGKRIAYVGQDPMSALDPLFKVQNQLVEAVRNHNSMSRPEACAEARRLLTAVRIPDPDSVLRKRPYELSGGMAQRVAIALAIAGSPELLIADEPTTALDVSVQMEVLGLLKNLQKERGLAIILVTHDWGVVADMCDRTLTLYAGELVESGSVDDVFILPSHPYTAALRRSDPHLQPTGTLLKSIPGTVPAPGEWPAHCRFADRCPLVSTACREVHPGLVDLPGEARTSRCIRTEELRAGRVHV